MGTRSRSTTGDNKTFKIRLEGIDAPESGQTFGDNAKQTLSAKVLNKQVAVNWTKLDEYQRLLATLYIGSISVNQQMISEGWAWPPISSITKIHNWPLHKREPDQPRKDYGPPKNRLPPWGNGATDPNQVEPSLKPEQYESCRWCPTLKTKMRVMNRWLWPTQPKRTCLCAVGHYGIKAGTHLQAGRFD